MESLKLGPRVKAFKEENDLNNLTPGPSLRDSITKVWTEIERLSHIFAVTPFTVKKEEHEMATSTQVMSVTLFAIALALTLPKRVQKSQWHHMVHVQFYSASLSPSDLATVAVMGHGQAAPVGDILLYDANQPHIVLCQTRNPRP